MKPNQTFSNRLVVWAAAIIVVIALGLGTTARAQSTYTWNGGGADNFWTTSGNWGGSSASVQAFLNFAGSTRLNNTNNFSAGSAGFQLYFKSGAGTFTLNGNSITFFDFGGNAPNIQNEGTGAQNFNIPFLHGNVNESDVLNINGNAGGGPITFNGTIAGGNGSGTRIIQLNNGNGTGTLTFNGIISDGSGTVEMKQLGGNTTIFAANNSYSGGTIESAGTLQLNTGGSFGSGTVQVTGSSSLIFNETGSLTVNNRIYNNGSNPTMTQSGTGTTILGGSTDNSGAVVTINAGTVQLNKTSSSTVHALGGGTDVINSGGLLQLSGTGGYQIYLGTSVTINPGGQFDFNGQSNELTSLNIGGTGINNTGAITNSSSSQGELILDQPSVIFANSSIGENGNLVIAGAGSLSNSTTVYYLTNLGPGTVELTNGPGGDNLNFHVVAAAGTVVLAKGNTSGGSNPSVHATGQITIMNGATAQLGGTGGFEIFEARSSTNLSGGVLDMNGQNQAWGTNSGSGSAGNLYLNGTGISGGGALINSSSTASVISNTFWAGAPFWPGVDLGSSSSIGGSGNLTIDTAISDNGGGFSLTKVGSGTLTLNSNNTYTGSTTISAGTLALGVNGAVSSSTISIAAGATLDVSAQTTFTSGSAITATGTGTTVGSTAAAIKGGTTVNLGSHSIALTFTPTGFSGDTTHPPLYISQGTLSLNGNTFTVNNNGGTALGAGTYRIIQQASGNVTSSGTYSVSVTGSGVAANMSAGIVVSGGNVNLVVAQPMASSPTYTRSPGISVVIPKSALYTTPDADGFTVSLNTFQNPTANSVTLLSDANNLYYQAPSPDNLTTDTFTYTITDGQGGTASGTVTINVASTVSLTADTGVAGNQMTLRYYAVPGGSTSLTYIVQRDTSVTFPSPVTLSTTTIPSGGSTQLITTADNPGGGTFFYRVLITSP